MINELHSELTALSGRMARREKLEAMLDSLRAEERGLSSRETELRAVLNKENADVDRLERTSAASLFYSMLGRRDEKLDKEQREACAAKLKYDAAARQLDDCRDRLERVRAEMEALAGTDRRYAEVFRLIQEELTADPNYAARICGLERALGEEASQIQEIREAASAAEACMDQIGRIENSLDSAEGWGTWDILGGGLLSDMAKHSHLDEAQEEAERLQTLLSRFRTELADVRVTAQLGQVNVDGLLRFADYFFDGLIADWTVLSHIHDSQQSVAQVKEQLSLALSQLCEMQRTHEAEKKRLERELTELVQSAK